MRYYFYVFAVAAVTMALFIIVTRWEDPTHMVALGSITSATISSLTLVFTLLSQDRNTLVEAKSRYAELLGDAKKALAYDIERMLLCCASAESFKALSQQIMFPEIYVHAVLNSEEVCEEICRESCREPADNPVFYAAKNTFLFRYNRLEQEAKQLRAEIFFENQLQDLGFGSLVKMLTR